MSLWFVAFQGSTPIGGPLVGWLMAVAGARAGLGLGAATIFAVAVLGLLALRRGATQARPPAERRPSDLHDHRQHHRPAPKAVVDERRKVVV